MPGGRELEGPALTVCKGGWGGRTEFHRGHVTWPPFSWGRQGGRACAQTLALLLGGSGVPRYTPRLFPAQQQDDLGAAFQTWMDTNGALRAEVPPRPLSTRAACPGEIVSNGSRVVCALHVACAECFIAFDGISQP